MNHYIAAMLFGVWVLAFFLLQESGVLSFVDDLKPDSLSLMVIIGIIFSFVGSYLIVIWAMFRKRAS